MANPAYKERCRSIWNGLRCRIWWDTSHTLHRWWNEESNIEWGKKLGQELCASAGHSDDCLDDCASPEDECAVERKHFRTGGVSCMGDSWFCSDCEGYFYWEGLHNLKTAEEYDEDDLYCHCCSTKRKATLDVST